MDEKKFVFTSDENTRKELLNLGFTEIQSGGSFFMFINNSTLKFDNSIKMDSVGFTNKLMF